MKGLLRSKLVLSLASLIMIAAAVSVPLSGSIPRAHAQAPTPVSFNVPNIDSNCNTSSFTPIVSFHTGDTVKGTASLVSTPPDPAEANEHEDLFLQGTNVPSIPSIAVDTGPQSFSFTATANGSLTACVGGSDGGDGDESGTVSGTVTPASTPTPTPTTPTATPTPTTVNHVCDKFGGSILSFCNNIANTIGTIQNESCEKPDSAACKALELKVGNAYCKLGASPGSCTPDIAQEVGHVLIGEAKCEIGLGVLKKISFIGPILSVSLEAISPLICPIINAVKDVAG